MESLFTSAAYGDWAGLRDFPVITKTLEKLMRSRFVDRASLLENHSAALYFGATIPEPFRSHECNSSFAKIGNLLRLSIGTAWCHLRYCVDCAEAEYQDHRYSWWHRDHQLPLATVCLEHKATLVMAPLHTLGISLPHELVHPKMCSTSKKPHELAIKIAKHELHLCSSTYRGRIQQKYEKTKNSLVGLSSELYDQHEAACRHVQEILMASGVARSIEDWNRLSRCILVLLHNGFDYGDPVAVSLLTLDL